MKIALAQIPSKKLDISYNLNIHLQAVAVAASHHAHLIIFPELSLTAYEPKAITASSFSLEDYLPQLKNVAKSFNMAIGLGTPLPYRSGLSIGLYVILPDGGSFIHYKHTLHTDEKPFFTEGPESDSLKIQGLKIGFGICYESLLEHHVQDKINQGIQLYIASVAKDKKGVESSLPIFSAYAAKHNIPFLMVNNVGPCDNFIGYGNTSMWHPNGELIGQLSAEMSQLLICDTLSFSTQTIDLSFIQ